MALSPLDLQTLFTQADKVGKQSMAQREGAALFQSIQHVRIQQQTDEKLRSVNETQNAGDGSQAINDENGGQAGQETPHGAHQEAKEEAEEGESIIRDPALGKNVDFSF